MNKKSQRIEDAVVQYIRKHFNFLDGEVLQNREMPDIQMQSNEKTIGLELTEYSIYDGQHPHNPKRRQDIIQGALIDAQRQHMQQGGRNIQLFIDVERHSHIKLRKQWKKLFLKLAKELDNEGRQSSETTYIARNISPDIRYCWYHTPAENLWEIWKYTPVFDGKNLQAERLQRIVHSKDELVSGYHYCDEYWLIIHMDFFDRNQDCHIDETTLQGVFSKRFNRIFIIRLAYCDYFEISNDVVQHIQGQQILS